MSLAMIFAVAGLVASGTFLVTSRSLSRIVLGFALLGHAAVLALLASGASALESTSRDGVAHPRDVPRDGEAMVRLATARAAKRRGCVCPINPQRPNPASRHSFGSCVLLPEPVSPHTTIVCRLRIKSINSWR